MDIAGRIVNCGDNELTAMLDGLNILIAEDNLLNQKVLKYIFEREHATFKFAGTGKEAIDIVETEKFDIILMDLYMPVMDGLMATKYIREVLKIDVPIVAITAGRFADEDKACIAAGMNACIYKPFEANSLCNQINTILKKQ